MTDTALDHVRFAAQTCDRVAHFVPQLIEVGTTDIAEVDLLEVVLNTFDRIQLRRIGCQGLQVNVSCCALGQKGLDLPIVNWCAIPNHEQFAPEVLLEMPHKSHHICTAQRAIGASQIDAAIAGNPANERAMVAREGFSQHNCLADWCIDLHGGRDQIESCLIYEDQCALFGLRLFLRLELV